jgi:hypothetical protein
MKYHMLTPVQTIGSRIRAIDRVPLGRMVIITVLVMTAFGLTQLGTAISQQIQGSDAASAAYTASLQKQVDGPNGTPAAGRDPSTQQQTSLAAAASRPNGPGLQTDTPAKDVNTSHAGHNHGSAAAAKKTSGVNSAGCYTDYGKQGEECLSVSIAGPGNNPTCAQIRSVFKNGILVSGADRFALDTNKNGTACDPADA